MAKFNGFSQDEINHIHSKSTRIQNGNSKKGPSGGRAQQSLSKQIHKTALATGAIDERNNNSTFDGNGTIESLRDAVHFQPLPAKKSTSASGQSNEDQVLEEITLQAADADSNFQGISLKDTEKYRKLVEEQNKQKKELLTKAIEQRIERTAAESKRIAEVKEELTKLDSELATDVAILRKEIDAVSWQYSQIQKSYQQIESQFLKAKLDLQMAREKKDLLAEHLCTIISHNEDRKSKKLSELLEKVGLTDEH